MANTANPVGTLKKMVDAKPRTTTRKIPIFFPELNVSKILLGFCCALRVVIEQHLPSLHQKYSNLYLIPISSKNLLPQIRQKRTHGMRRNYSIVSSPGTDHTGFEYRYQYPWYTTLVSSILAD